MHCYINVKVITHSKSFKIDVIDKEDKLVKIYTTQPPTKNRANKELLKNLKHIFKCNVEIVKGMNSSKKLIRIELPCDLVWRLLSSRG